MSDVKPNDPTPIHHADDVVHLYSGVGADIKSGVEIEIPFFNPKSANLDVMSLSQNKVLKNAAQDALIGDWIHNEPTSELLEVASIAAPLSGIKDVMDDTNKKMAILLEKAEKLGLKRSYFQELPERTSDDLLSRIVNVDRYKVMYAPYRDDMRETVRYFAVCKSNQVSVSYKNPDHGLNDVRRLYFLAPFLFLLTDNSTGFMEGKAFSGHAGMHLRHNGLDQRRGGVMPYAITARSGDEFFARHIDHVFNNPLFMYYNLEGGLERVPSGDWGVTFNTLKSRGLNTNSNYLLAQSVLWPDVKIAALKNAQGNVYNHRYEARMFGVGAHQHQTALIITAALAMHEDFAASVDDLLLRYGFDSATPKASLELLENSYANARNHNGKFFDIAYGHGVMRAFAKEFADLVEDIADDLGLDDELQPLLTICRTGCSDGKINRILFPTLKDVLDFQRSYDPALLENPDLCAKNYLFHNTSGKSNKDALKPCCG